MRRIFWLSIVIFWVILTILPLSAYAAVDKDTVAVWLFDEGAGDTVRDFSGNGHDGKLMGDPKWTGAEHGKGLDFEGDIANYVEVPHSDDLNLEQWTIEGWFLVRSVIGGWDCPFAKETADPIVRNYALHLEGGTGILHGSISMDNAFGHATFGAINVADSEWHYLATTYDGNKCTLYIDGEEDFGRSAGGANGEIGGPPDTGDGPLTIGANTTAAYTFDGIIDEIRLSSIARTQEEIVEAMTKGLKAMAAVSPGGKLTATWAGIKQQ